MLKSRLDLLLEAVGDADPVMILPHNDPDPDAIASAVALRYLLTETLQVDSHVVYQGIVGRAENRALVRYLGHPLQRLTEAHLHQARAVALVDTQPGAGNNALPRGRAATIVIDHHPPLPETASAAFADLRPDWGATSTILTEYFRAANIELMPPLATALFYGIKSDTLGLSRGASQTDANAYLYLQPRINAKALGEIEHAQVPIGYFRSFDVTLHAARVYDGVVVAYIGLMEYPDLAAEMADFLLRLNQSRWVICIGAFKDLLILSVRTRGLDDDAGAFVQALVRGEGQAGGHGYMAGGQIPLVGRDPELVGHQLRQRALEHFRIPAEAFGQPLV